MLELSTDDDIEFEAIAEPLTPAFAAETNQNQNIANHTNKNTIYPNNLTNKSKSDAPTFVKNIQNGEEGWQHLKAFRPKQPAQPAPAQPAKYTSDAASSGSWILAFQAFFTPKQPSLSQQPPSTQQQTEPPVQQPQPEQTPLPQQQNSSSKKAIYLFGAGLIIMGLFIIDEKYHNSKMFNSILNFVTTLPSTSKEFFSPVALHAAQMFQENVHSIAYNAEKIFKDKMKM